MESIEALASDYVSRHFSPRLLALGALAGQTQTACEDVEKRLVSVLRHWQEPDFTRPLLEIGWEEGCNYDPAEAGTLIKALVVIAVRNSLLEDMGSTRPFHPTFQAKPSPIIRDTDMRAITSEAISFFETADLCVPLNSLKESSDWDIFGELPQRYPVTWNALREASRLDGGERRLRLIDASPPDFDLTAAASLTSGMKTVVTSGIDPRSDSTLINILNSVRTGETGLVFFPAFKWFTRHTEKLFRAFEFVLCSGAQIVTLNYCFSRDVICKRRFLLKPSHNMSEIADQLGDKRGLCRRHRDALECAQAAG